MNEPLLISLMDPEGRRPPPRPPVNFLIPTTKPPECAPLVLSLAAAGNVMTRSVAIAGAEVSLDSKKRETRGAPGGLGRPVPVLLGVSVEIVETRLSDEVVTVMVGTWSAGWGGRGGTMGANVDFEGVNAAP